MRKTHIHKIFTLAAVLLGLSRIEAATVAGLNLDSLPREFGYPASHRYGVVLRHKNYTVIYFEKYRLVYWAAYSLTKDMLSGAYENVYELRPDPMTREFAEPGDYKGSGYVPGFLVPPDFLTADSNARREGFYMTNTVPLKQGFRKSLWLKMEAQERNWVETGARLWVVAGPIVTDSTKTIGAGKVRIPTYLFNVILMAKGDEVYEAAFLFPTVGARNFRKPIEEFLVPVDRVESMTGFDFFPSLPDSLENALESKPAKITF